MVRRTVFACALALALAPVSPAAASDSPELMDVPKKRTTSPKGHAPKATPASVAKKPADGPQLDWRSRVAVAIDPETRPAMAGRFEALRRFEERVP